MGLCTLAEAKLQLGKGAGTVDDAEVQSYIDSITAPVEYICGPIVPVTVTNEMHKPLGGVIVLHNTPMVSVTTLTEYVGSAAYPYTLITTPATSGAYTYLLEASKGRITRYMSGGEVPFFGGLVMVTYQAGLATVPAEINLAARLIVQSLWRTQNGGAGLPQLSDEPVTDFQGFDAPIPARAAMILESHRRLSGIA